MTGHNTAVVAEIAGGRYLLGLDKAHKLEIRPPEGHATVIENRPVTGFAAAVDGGGRLHAVAWLLSRHLMYYTSTEGSVFTRSTLLSADGSLRLRDLLIDGSGGVSIAYVAETEHADTLVCYRNGGTGWEGVRLVEAEHPQRLTALQFDGAPGPINILYGVKDAGRTAVMSRPAAGESPPEAVATVTGGLGDFCALTSGGVRQVCWIADGHHVINGLRQTEEPWSRSWPCLKREGDGVHCLWLENGMLHGLLLSAQRASLRPAALREALPCVLALPGESRRTIVDGNTLGEMALLPEISDRPQGMGRNAQAQGVRQGDITLTDVVRNQAIYITRMQESLGAMERNVLRMQSEVSRLSREMSAMLRAREASARPELKIAAHAAPKVWEPQMENDPVVGEPAPEPGGGRPGPDGGQPEPEDKQPEPEGGQPKPEDKQPEPEGGQPEPEGGQPEPDGRQPEPEGGEPEAPSGSPADAGEAAGYCGT